MKQGHSNLRYGYCVSDHHGTLAFFETSMICRRWPWQDGMGGSLSFKEKVGYYNVVQPMASSAKPSDFRRLPSPCHWDLTDNRFIPESSSNDSFGQMLQVNRKAHSLNSDVFDVLR
jgi:hypothetical protein